MCVTLREQMSIKRNSLITFATDDYKKQGLTPKFLQRKKNLVIHAKFIKNISLDEKNPMK